jgi:hypothetical protein
MQDGVKQSHPQLELIGRATSLYRGAINHSASAFQIGRLGPALGSFRANACYGEPFPLIKVQFDIFHANRDAPR